MKMFGRAIQTAILGALVALLFGPLVADGKKITSFAGPYIVYTDKFYSCGGTDWSWNLHTTYFNPQKPKEAQRITGWVNGTGAPVVDSQYMHIVMDVRSNNQWKENAFVFSFPKGACSTLKKQIPEFYYRIFHKDRNNDKGCELQPGLYQVEDEPIPWLFPNFPVMPYGEYRFRLKTGDPGQPPACCFIVECHVVPKTG